MPLLFDDGIRRAHMGHTTLEEVFRVAFLLLTMSVFHYKAYNASGKAISGALEADSLTTLETRLKTAGVWLLEAREGVAHFDVSSDKPVR